MNSSVASLPSILNLELFRIELSDHESDLIDSLIAHRDIIRPFPNVHRLHIVNTCMLTDVRQEVASASFPKLPLRHLRLRHDREGIILRKFLEAKCLELITSLDIECGWPDATSAMNRVMEQHGRHLVSIVVLIIKYHSEYCLSFGRDHSVLN